MARYLQVSNDIEEVSVPDVPVMTKPVIRGERRRWYVHLALLGTLAGSLVTLIYLSHSITIHVIFGVAFMVFVLIHLYQRRRTVASLATQFIRTSHRSKGPSRLAVSDTILELLVANVLVSGIVDAVSHHATQLNFLGSLSFPPGLIQWHKLASLVLVVYVIVHVSRRWRRLRRSHIR
jgi:hypothetical protein